MPKIDARQHERVRDLQDFESRLRAVRDSAGPQIWDPSKRTAWSADLVFEPRLSAEQRRRLRGVLESQGGRLHVEPTTPIPPMPANSASVDIYASGEFTGPPFGLADSLASAFELAGERQWWQMRFWSIADGRVDARYTALGEGVNPRAFVISAFADYTSSGIGRQTGARWLQDRFVPVPIATWKGPDPQPGRIAIRYLPGTSIYSNDYVSEQELADLIAGDTRPQLGFNHYPYNFYPGGKGGGGLEPVTVEIIVGGALSAYALSIISAIGTDTWAALKRGIRRLRQHRSNTVSAAQLKLAIEFGPKQWIVVRGNRRPLDDKLMDSVEKLTLPQLPPGSFELLISWDSDQNKWVISFGQPWSDG